MFRQLIKDYFLFTQKERIAIITLILLIVFVYLLPDFIKPASSKIPAHEIEEFKMLQQQITKADDEQRNNQSKTSNDEEEDIYTIAHAAPGKAINEIEELFYFDPNTLSETGWKKLGLRDKTIGTIQKYLAKGGHFNKATDLKKIYGLRPNEYERILPYIRLSDHPAVNKQWKDYSADNKPPDGYSSANDLLSGDAAGNGSVANSLSDESLLTRNRVNKETSLPASFRNAHSAKDFSNHRIVRHIIDINTADTTAFIALPGIGSKLANRVVYFREKLGGFYAVEQVGETYGLADSTFQKIKPFLNTGKTALRQIDINKADIETLRQHPYIKWNMANALLRYREQHGPFKSVEELQQVVAIGPENYKRILPYLTIGKD